MRFSMRGRIFLPWHAQAVVTLRLICVYDPACQYRQALLDIVDVKLLKVEPLATGVRTGELFGQ
jgi:hypothetical protein